MAIEHVNSSQYLVPIGGFTHAVTVDVAGAKWVFVSGLTARNADGEIQGVGDVIQQTRQILTSLRTILADAGAGLGDVVRMVTYMIDIEEYSAFNDVRREFFGDVLPAETSVQISRLYDRQQLVEIEATAIVA
ncbi:2-iminobutanoate/2-iminopropanoate deaminase [Marmoricola sp. URHA0025 HA25]